MFIFNAPMFFDDIFEDAKSMLTEETINKIRLSSGSTHDDLSDLVGAEELPSLYGGLCKCKASCVYSDKGPWSPTENYINFAESEEDGNELNFKEDDDGEDLIGRGGEIDGLRFALKST